MNWRNCFLGACLTVACADVLCAAEDGRPKVTGPRATSGDSASEPNWDEHNEILNSGGDSGIGIDIQGASESIELIENHIAENRDRSKRAGIRIGAETKNIRLADNRIEGVSIDVSDLRQPGPMK